MHTVLEHVQRFSGGFILAPVQHLKPNLSYLANQSKFKQEPIKTSERFLELSVVREAETKRDDDRPEAHRNFSTNICVSQTAMFTFWLWLLF